MQKMINTKDQTNRLYNDLSWTWRIISPPEDYVEETREIADRISNESDSELHSLLNIGCGGGHNDFTLKNTFKVTGVDIAENMLKLARDLNPEVQYFFGDMRSLRLDKKFDVVTIFDSILYMTTKDDLIKAFRTAYFHLKPGGLFYTEQETIKSQFKQNSTTVTTSNKNDIGLTLIDNAFDPDPTDNSYEGTHIHLIRREGKLAVEFDHHVCGIFTEDEFQDCLKQAGFQIKRVFNLNAPPGIAGFICIRPP